jgi:hypothetical protein
MPEGVEQASDVAVQCDKFSSGFEEPCSTGWLHLDASVNNAALTDLEFIRP